MRYIRLGSTGLQVSALGLGTMGYGSPNWRPWVLDAEASAPVLRRALDLGINFFDMADFYSLGANEEVVGRTLLSAARREDLVLASKVYYPLSDAPNDQGLSRKHILEAIDGSLRRIGSDYLDLYIVHAFDPATPLEETMEALNDVVRAGKARYLGASTMYAWQFAKMNAIAERNGWARFVNMQCQYSLLYREEEREMLPYCRHEGVGITSFSPLARGMLAGAADLRMKTDVFTQEFFGDEVDRAIVARVADLARRRGVSPAEIAMAWVVHSGAVDCSLIGAQTVAELETAVRAPDLVLSAEERAWLEAPYRPADMINDHAPPRRRRGLPAELRDDA
ncbi:aldo/keto reductase [Phenylobacterium sp.]|uniref:aldo/keto reductase n=1 Tax=Phenylobacterium sp. TaxID=1871053 RepID=UPI0025EEAF93|nr:aldo/keto reductase [Phenylobacterium sp.]